MEPTVGDVGAVTGNDAAARQAQSFGPVDVRRLTLSECHEGRQVATMVQTHVEFDGPLGGAESGPWEEFQAEVNDGCIQGIEPVLKAEPVLRSDHLASSKKSVKDLFVKEIGLLFVDSSQIGSGEAPTAKVIELVPLGAHIVDDIPQASPARELGHGQGHELRPAIGASELATGMKPICEGLKLMSRDHLDELIEDRVMMGQGSDLLLNQRFVHH